MTPLLLARDCSAYVFSTSVPAAARHRPWQRDPRHTQRLQEREPF